MIARLRAAWARLLALGRKQELDSELAEELASHIEMLTPQQGGYRGAPTRVGYNGRRFSGHAGQQSIEDVGHDRAFSSGPCCGAPRNDGRSSGFHDRVRR